jgi:hypothetical protein
MKQHRELSSRFFKFYQPRGKGLKRFQQPVHCLLGFLKPLTGKGKIKKKIMVFMK